MWDGILDPLIVTKDYNKASLYYAHQKVNSGLDRFFPNPEFRCNRHFIGSAYVQPKEHIFYIIDRKLVRCIGGSYKNNLFVIRLIQSHKIWYINENKNPYNEFTRY